MFRLYEGDKMKFRHNNINFEIEIHYGSRKICLTTYSDSVKDFIEHNTLFTKTEIFKHLENKYDLKLKYDDVRFDLICELDMHIDTLDKLKRIQEDYDKLKKEDIELRNIIQQNNMVTK